MNGFRVTIIFKDARGKQHTFFETLSEAVSCIGTSSRLFGLVVNGWTICTHVQNRDTQWDWVPIANSDWLKKTFKLKVVEEVPYDYKEE